ncbi:TPA: NAD/NADP transhydrogenase beta subunit [Vibrio harveyi]|uniref:NAD/NADP transhydrogenase beta subunit n=3 Tax=Vibrio harveyi TaxID=669 RepID=A0A8B3D8E1_VIBHA|nr:NAD/NADP transhydrogenase beta subunit [Vibrio harveyi]HDM8127096.1 NAD/NADP transhydrogenase beta subunit [Vibrio harveyi]
MGLMFQPSLCLLGDQEFSISQLTNHTLKPSEFSVSNFEEIDSLSIIDTLDSYSNYLRKRDISGHVFLLLPNITDKNILRRVIASFLSIFSKVEADKIALYPYGNASFLMALNSIERLVKKNNSVWVVAINAIDSGYGLDSLVMARCSMGHRGLRPYKVAVDLDFEGTDTATSNITKQLGLVCTHLLDEIALSIEGEEPVWLESIQFLSPWITADTSYQLIDSITGPLGPCNGLLKALCVYQQQTNRNISNYCGLQIDVERYGYAVGVLYRWVNE